VIQDSRARNGRAHNYAARGALIVGEDDATLKSTARQSRHRRSASQTKRREAQRGASVASRQRAVRKKEGESLLK